MRYVAVVLMDELSCRCATFITNVLDSDNDAVSYVAHGVYLSRMLSPIGRNALFCCLRYGVLFKKTLHLLRKFLLVSVFGMLSLLFTRAAIC